MPRFFGTGALLVLVALGLSARPAPAQEYVSVADTPDAVLEQPEEAAPPFPWFWANAEYLLWWTKGAGVPPLLTTGSTGIVGAGDTTVLFGGNKFDPSPVPGGRFTLGMWVDPVKMYGFEGSYFFLDDRTEYRTARSSAAGSPALYVPYINFANGQETATAIASPGAAAGTAVEKLTGQLHNAEVSLVQVLRDTEGLRVDMLCGFRYLDLHEEVSLTTSRVTLPGGEPVFLTHDSFKTRNAFYGAQLGARADWHYDRFFVNATGKVAVGSIDQRSDITGRVLSATGVSQQNFPGGYFAQPSNMGSRRLGRLSAIPEFNLNVGMNLAPWARIYTGYTFLFIPTVARAGEQIDRIINIGQAPAITGAAPTSARMHPFSPIQQNNYWAQGLNFGVEFRF